MTESKPPDEKRHSQASQLFLKHYNYVRYVAFQVAPFRDLIDDIVNDTFIRFVSKAESWTYPEDIKPLLYRIAQNIAREYWRSYLKELPTEMAQLEELAAEVLQEQNESDQNWNLEVEMDQMMKCIAKLPLDQRLLIEMHYFHKISFVELASRDNKRVNTIQKMASRTRVLLRKCLEKALGLCRRKGAENDD